MTKGTLKWRLTKLPTSEEVLKLLSEKLITQEEARSILFSHEEEDLSPAKTLPSQREEELKSQIKFLQELVEKLSNNQPSRIVEVIRDVEIRYKRNPWYEPYKFYCSTADASTQLVAGATGLNLNASLSGSLGKGTDLDFTSLKTF